MDEQRKKKVKIAAALAIVAIAIVLVVVVQSSRGVVAPCYPVNNRPDPIDVSKLQNIASKDFKALATAAALISFPKDGTFLELNLNSIESTKIAENIDVLELNFDCAKMYFEIEQKLEEVSKYTVNTVYVSFSAGKEAGYDFYLREFLFESPADKRCSCGVGMYYTGVPIFVLKEKNPIVVTFPRLEFELNGDPESYKIGKYTKPPSKQSCCLIE